MDKTVGIAAIATLLAGAGYLLKEGKTTNMSAENQVFMATGRAISSKKINKSFFNKQLPSILTKAQTDEWKALEKKIQSENLWNDIDRGVYQQWQKYNWLVEGQKTYPLGERETAYIVLANEIDRAIAIYYSQKSQEATLNDLKKATTQLLKFMKSNAVSSAFKNNLDANGNPTRLTQMQFQNGVLLPLIQARLARGSLLETANRIEDAAAKYETVMKSSVNPNYSLTASNLLDMNNQEGRYFGQWLYNTCANAYNYGNDTMLTKEGLLQHLTSYFYSRMRNHGSPYLNNPLRADKYNQVNPPAFTLTPEVKKYILDMMNSSNIVRWYQYTQFFKENPEIKVVGGRDYPYSQRKESYFKEYTRRQNTQFFFALPPSFRLSESEMKSYLGREARKVLTLMKKEMQPAKTRIKAKQTAQKMSVKVAQREYVKAMQKVLDGKKIIVGYDNGKPVKDVIPVESRVDAVFTMLIFPNNNANYLGIRPQKMIKQYHANNTGGVVEEYDRELYQVGGMVSMSYLFDKLTVPNSLFAALEAKLLENKDSQMRSADDQIARIAAQMQRPLQQKKDAQTQYYERRALLMDKVRRQVQP